MPLSGFVVFDTAKIGPFHRPRKLFSHFLHPIWRHPTQTATSICRSLKICRVRHHFFHFFLIFPINFDNIPQIIQHPFIPSSISKHRTSKCKRHIRLPQHLPIHPTHFSSVVQQGRGRTNPKDKVMKRCIHLSFQESKTSIFCAIFSGKYQK